MASGEFWLTEAQFARLAPLLPNDTRGVARVDNRRVISCIVHVLQFGSRWRDAPEIYGLRKTFSNRFCLLGAYRCVAGGFYRARGRGWPARGAIARQHPLQSAPLRPWRKRGPAPAIDRSRGGRTSKINLAVDHFGRPHRLTARPGHRGNASMAVELLGEWTPRESVADAAYDSDAFCSLLTERGCLPLIPNNPTRKRHHPFDRTAYRRRNLIERCFSRLKRLFRIAT